MSAKVESNLDENGRSFGDALVEIAEGGLLRLAVSKPVQQAIGRLIFGIADVPTAKLEQWAQGIRTDTAAEKQITSALAQKAKIQATADADLAGRSLERWTRQLRDKQHAREKVAIHTLAVLGEQALPPEAKAPPDEFMGPFEQLAETATSSSLVDLLARILSGEIRKPGLISRRTLQLVSIIDTEVIDAFTNLLRYTTLDGFMYIPSSRFQQLHRSLSLLCELSIYEQNGLQSLPWRDDGVAILKFAGMVIIATRMKEPLAPPIVDGANLTPSGRVLADLLPMRPDAPIEEIAASLYEDSALVERVQVAPCTPDQERIPLDSLRDIPKRPPENQPRQ